MSDSLVLVACYDFEWANLQHQLVDGLEYHLVLFGNEKDKTKLDIDPLKFTLIDVSQSQFDYRDKFLKPASDLFLWLKNNDRYSKLICGQFGGISFFVLSHKFVSCDFTNISVEVVKTVSAEHWSDFNQCFKDLDTVARIYLEQEVCRLLSVKPVTDVSDNTSCISIVIPHHNRSTVIQHTLYSLELQTNVNFRVIVVDDNSCSEEYLQLQQTIADFRFKGLDISLIRNEVSFGAAESRNIGCNSVEGGYVLFLDDDDILHPGALDSLLEAQRRTNSDFVTTSFVFFNGGGMPDFENDSGILLHFYGADDWHNAIYKNCVGGITCLYKVDVFKAIGGFKCQKVAGEEDWQLILRLKSKGFAHSFHPFPLLWYRNTDFSLSKKMLRFQSRQALFSIYKERLPSELKHLPEMLNYYIDKSKRHEKYSEESLFQLAYKLAGLPNFPIYIYGAGEVGKRVYKMLAALGLNTRVITFVDRNAGFIESIEGRSVQRLEQTKIGSESIVVIASFSFVDEIRDAVKKQSETDYILTMESS